MHNFNRSFQTGAKVFWLGRDKQLPSIRAIEMSRKEIEEGSYLVDRGGGR
ncbi:hypothetical protein C2845_PM13G07390 [Panicum miliaceum]|uniref:Uncharacterized protein n=1 Tax=Panicum miliaceum TaxID=4540 RepID=A0A3L6RKV0_PANMI|nr:hypothetical protein C2845_PM13G07390 [Panicum miliaceum]